jgi:hypothetical protein
VQKLDSGGGLTLVSHSGFPVPLYQFTTHPPSDNILEKRELRNGFGQGPHPAIVLPAATDRTKSVPNTGKYTGISAY